MDSDLIQLTQIQQEPSTSYRVVRTVFQFTLALYQQTESGSTQNKSHRQVAKVNTCLYIFCQLVNLISMSQFVLSAYLIGSRAGTRNGQSLNNDTPGIIRSFDEALARLFASIPELGVFFYTGIVLEQINTQLTYRLFPGALVQATMVRFILNPVGELARIDALTCDKLDQIDRAVSAHLGWRLGKEAKFLSPTSSLISRAGLPQLCKKYILDQGTSLLGPSHLGRIARQPMRRLKKARLVLAHLRTHLWLLRPTVYTSVNLKNTVRRVYNTFAPRLVVDTLLYMCSLVFALIAYRSSCPLLMAEREATLASPEPGHCSIIADTPVLLLLLEQQLVILLLSITLLGMTLILTIQIIHQHQLIAWIEADLSTSLQMLRRQLLDDYPGQQFDDERHLRLLCTSVTKYWLFVADSGRSMRMISMGALVAFCIGLYMSLASWFGYRYRDPSRFDYITLFTIVVWLYENLVILVCASIPARESRVKLCAWSLVASVVELSNHLADESLLFEPLFSMWHRTIISDKFNESLAVRFFTRPLNYKLVLRLNFLSISLILILSSRISS